MKCHRCDEETSCHIMSIFNTDELCLKCKKKEEEHPKFADAQEAEMDAVKSGNFNFRGIGWPGDA